MNEIQCALFSMRDEGYRDFQARLMPTVDKEKIIGVRTPDLRKYAKSIKDTSLANDFLSSLPHTYYEENNLHAFLIEQIKDFGECVLALEVFLPYVDNWATCDMMRPKCLKNGKNKLLSKALEWVLSPHCYTIRYGIAALMLYFLEEDFEVRFLDVVCNIKSDEYYVNMMRAWYFATALAMQYESTLPYITEHRLDSWTHGKTIRKACESYRISEEQKRFLKSVKL